MTRKIDSYIS